MALRVKIGSSTTYSATTTSGVTLLGDSKGEPEAEPQGLRFRYDTESAELVFWLHIEKADELTVKQAIDDVRTAVMGPNLFNDVQVDNGSDASIIALFKTSDGTYRNRKGEVLEVLMSPTIAVVRCTFTFSNVEDYARGGGAAGAEQFVDGLIECQAERNAGGYLSVTLSATFRGTSGTTAFSAAKAWVTAILGRSTAPAQLPWLPAKDVLRVVDNFFTPFLQNDSSNLSQDRVTATIVLRELDDALKSVIDDIRSIAYEIRQVPQTLPSLQQPGFDCAINGALEFKTAGLTAFDSGDSAPGFLTTAEIAAALDIVVAAAKARAGWTDFVPMQTGLYPAGNDGVLRFEIAGVANGGQNPIIEFTEHVQSEDVDLSYSDTDTRNRKWNYGVGEQMRVKRHVLNVVRVGAVPTYSQPASIPNGFTVKRFAQDESTPATIKSIGLAGDGRIIYSASWDVTYEDTVGEREGTQDVTNVSGTTSVGGSASSGNRLEGQ